MLGLRSGYRGGRCHDHSRLRCNLRSDRLSAVGRGSAVSALIPQRPRLWQQALEPSAEQRVYLDGFVSLFPPRLG
jgi:hypothetical protein